MDTNLTICWASHNCFDVVGYKKAAIVQKPFLELIPEEDHPHVLGMIRQAEQLDQPGNARAVYRRLTAQGKLLLVEAEARAIVQKPAEVTHYFALRHAAGRRWGPAVDGASGLCAAGLCDALVQPRARPRTRGHGR